MIGCVVALFVILYTSNKNAMTAQIFPDERNNGIEVFSKGSPTKFTKLTFYKLKSIWLRTVIVLLLLASAYP